VQKIRGEGPPLRGREARGCSTLPFGSDSARKRKRGNICVLRETISWRKNRRGLCEPKKANNLMRGRGPGPERRESALPKKRKAREQKLCGKTLNDGGKNRH